MEGLKGIDDIIETLIDQDLIDLGEFGLQEAIKGFAVQIPDNKTLYIGRRLDLSQSPTDYKNESRISVCIKEMKEQKINCNYIFFKPIDRVNDVCRPIWIKEEVVADSTYLDIFNRLHRNKKKSFFQGTVVLTFNLSEKTLTTFELK